MSSCVREVEAHLSRDLEAVLGMADVVSLHCPLTPQTHHLINAERLALMKPTAFLVNTARGAVALSQNAA